MNGLFRACAALLLVLAPAQLLAQKGRPVVAIYAMDDLAQTGKAPQFSQMIETAIEATNKFRVIEREHMGKLLGEQGRAKAGLVTTNRPGKIGGFEGADFLIYGTITSVSLTNKADFGTTFLAGMMAGQNNPHPACSNAFATLGIDIKITDGNTGEIKQVTRINEQQKSAAVCGANGQIDVALLMRSAADKVATNLVTTIYPIQIADVQDDGSMMLNYGEGAIQPGAIMTVFQKGRKIIDPATGETIGNSETRLGFLRVTDVQGRLSKALPASDFATLPPVGSIVRVASADDLLALKAQSKQKKK